MQLERLLGPTYLTGLGPSVGGELYTVVSQDQVSKARARTPAGLNWAQLESDFQALGGTLAKTL